MDIQHTGKTKDVFLVVSFIVLVLVLIWVATAEGPEGNYYAYVFGWGPTITMGDREVAELYGKEFGAPITPGVHLMNKEGKLVSPVLGGLTMAFKGLTGGGREFRVGLEGVRVGLGHDPVGLTVLIILPMLLLLIGLIGYRFIRARRPVGNGG